ncbi:hypothetical protein UA08_03942 [Talaromyces atroroseus]|uniref:Indoleamine 2,3-dioxygenase n=1 Tax=Talaromyces atroroseus TaxID=1441469 RepID=A0A1Q5Q8V8_TALAT|nr:hypothetical protein UA08_03942 [Talaromyces atroroseus]OKL60566.1 hypothetical protein UA08_03942 [Talaromyces atroroseus]
MASDIGLPTLEAYDVSPRTGFLREIVSCESHLHPYFHPWYFHPWIRVTRDLQSLIKDNRIRSVVDGLLVLSRERLETTSQRKKAYSMLGFICHAYIWGGQEPADLYHLDSLATQITFTGSIDESWFYLVSVAIEARGGPLIGAILDAVRWHPGYMRRVNCDPHLFDHKICLFLSGSSGNEKLPNGVYFDNGTHPMQPFRFAGGSNAQSSLIQFIDIALGVTHYPTGISAGKRNTDSFHEEKSEVCVDLALIAAS